MAEALPTAGPVGALVLFLLPLQNISSTLPILAVTRRCERSRLSCVAEGCNPPWKSYRGRGREESVRIDEERVEAIGFGHRTDERGALVVCASPASGTDCTSNHPRARGDLAVKLEYGVSVEPAERDAREALLAGGEAQRHGVGTPGTSASAPWGTLARPAGQDLTLGDMR